MASYDWLHNPLKSHSQATCFSVGGCCLIWDKTNVHQYSEMRAVDGLWICTVEHGMPFPILLPQEKTAAGTTQEKTTSQLRAQLQQVVAELEVCSFLQLV